MYRCNRIVLRQSAYRVAIALHSVNLLTRLQSSSGIRAQSIYIVPLVLNAGLYAWRDKVARAEDESTGYVLSRNLLQKLAMQMPTTASKVRSFCKSRLVTEPQHCYSLLTRSALQQLHGSHTAVTNAEVYLWQIYLSSCLLYDSQLSNGTSQLHCSGIKLPFAKLLSDV